MNIEKHEKALKRRRFDVEQYLQKLIENKIVTFACQLSQTIQTNIQILILFFVFREKCHTIQMISFVFAYPIKRKHQRTTPNPQHINDDAYTFIFVNVS